MYDISLYIKSAKAIAIIVIAAVIITYISVISIQNRSYKQEIVRLKVDLSTLKGNFQECSDKITVQNAKIQAMAIDMEERKAQYELSAKEIDTYASNELEKYYTSGQYGGDCQTKLDKILSIQQGLSDEL